MRSNGYNLMRDDSALLEEHENSPPSFSVHLYPDHWTLNNGPKFSYNNPVSSILDDIRAFRIPTDFTQIFDDAGVPYYSGCMIVELLDFRPARAREPILERPDKQRVVLRPNGETLWADICTMNAKAGSKWSDMDALQVESKLLLATSSPLCLDPDPSLTRIVNSILRVSTPNIPNSLKRKAAAMVDLEEDETEKAKRAKVMQFMNPQFSPTRKPFLPSYKILTVLERQRAAKGQQTSQSASTAPAPTDAPSGTMAPPSINVQQPPDKTLLTAVSHLTTSYSQPTATSQPAPPAVPQTQTAPQPQPAVETSRSVSPSKQQQQASNGTILQRPPSRPAITPQANPINEQPQASGQATQPVQFNPPLPPSNFLNPNVPASRRRPSGAVRPITPAVTSASPPAQQVTNRQVQPQAHAPPQAQTQAHAQTQPQLQSTSQPAGQLQPQPQQVPPPIQQQARPIQITPNLSTLQAMPQFRNAAQIYANPGGMPMSQAAALQAAQRQSINGRQTPVNRVGSSASPAPSSAMAQSPMLAAAAAAMMSRQNTPVATNTQTARGSPLVGSHPVAARPIAAQNGTPQPSQQAMPGTHPGMMQPGAPMNAALAYQYQQRLAYFQAQQRAVQQQAQMHQQGRMTPAPQQQQQNQQLGTGQSQQTTQEQAAAMQRAFSSGVPMTPQNFQYMGLNVNPQQHLFMRQRVPLVSAGIGPILPNGQQQVPQVPPFMPPGMTMQQMQGLGRGGGLPNR